MGMRNICFKIYFKIENIIIPTLRFSQDIYEDILISHVNSKCEWLDIGCGHKLLPDWRSIQEKKLISNCKTIVGLDYDFNNLKNHKNIHLKVNGDASHLPFKNNLFDLITANMVVEHLINPTVQFQEIWRILKPGGLFIFHTPNILGYTTIIARLIPEIIKRKLICLVQGGKEEDIFHTYYRANSITKILKLAKITGFNSCKIKSIVSSAEFINILPLAILELLWIKILMKRSFKILRLNIIAILKK